MTAGGYVLSCRLTSDPLWLGIYLFLWWFLLVIFGLFLLHWRYELPCQDKLPEFHFTPILGCIRILWLVSHPLGLGLDKALCGWNSVKMGQMILALSEIYLPDNVTQAAPHIVVFIAKLPQLAGNKHEPRASVFVQPLQHGFIDGIYP